MNNEERKFVTSIDCSPRFLALLQAPPNTRKLTFSIEAGGILVCKALYWTGVFDEMAEKEWEVVLPETSAFYQLIRGDLS